MLLPINNLNHLPTQTKPISVFQNPKPISPSLIRCLASQTAIQRIADKLRSLGFTEQNPKPKTLNATLETTLSEGEIFIPLPNQLSKYRVGHTLDPSWSTPENPVPRPGSGRAIVRYHELSEEINKQKEVKRREKKIKVPTLAELSLPEDELRRLRRIGIGEKRKIKVGKAGITEGIVNGVHERWRRSEVVVIVCEDLCRVNMKRTHDLLERKTGGLVVWRVGSKIALYRGVNYTYPYFEVDNTTADGTSNDTVKDGDEHCEGDKMGSSPSGNEGLKFSGPTLSNRTHRPPLVQGVGVPNRVRFQFPGEAQLVEEADSLLEGLGPRFTDWWGYEPLPVDADLLPAIVPGFKKPFRLLPYGIKSTLTNDEMTTLKRLGRPLPCHFALGRNRNLQGLATSIIKLWERCEIAKIAVKRGVQNTNSEMMAEELKRLTGGTLLSRDREFIVLYRGKDFLPSAASSAIKERRKLAFNVDRDRRDDSMSGEGEKEAEDVGDGTRVSACQDEVPGNSDHSYDLFKQRKLELTKAATKRTSIRLSMALEKKAKAEKRLAEIEKSAIPEQPGTDKEGITEEERYMLRKVGLKMKPFLLLGRRGVFDGTIENMHLHWKYRELVKLICKERSFKTVQEVARSLEAESGGILVAVEKVSKGHAIIVYRGKNYQRPACLRPQTLLSKREAMKRSLEAQRHKSLKLHVLKLTRDIDDLKQKLAKDEEVCMQSSNEVKEELIGTEPATYMRSVPELDSDNNSSSAVPTNCKDNLGPSNGNRIGGSELESLPGPLGKESHASVNSVQPDEQTSQANPSLQSTERCTHPHDSAEHCLPGNENLRTTVESSITEPEESTSISTKKENNTSSRAIRLSNKDRLMLRKQALKMKKRPVLAVGRSNIVTGVAKTIRTHFKKYPLAIVNVKGRAKGTSVQEVVFQLEQATGGVLVSQEPSKVILYRGWGAFDEPAKKNASDLSPQLPVSPDLMAAIQVECGLQNNQERKQTSSTES